MRFFASMFSEPNGSPSTTRALAALVCVTVVGVWGWVSVRKMALQPLDPEHVMLVVGALGVKAWQRGKETPPSVNGSKPETQTQTKP